MRRRFVQDGQARGFHFVSGSHRVAALEDDRALFWLGEIAGPDRGKRRHIADLRLHREEVADEFRAPGALIVGGVAADLPFARVGGAVRFAVVGVGYFLPILAVAGDMDFVFDDGGSDAGNRFVRHRLAIV